MKHFKFYLILLVLFCACSKENGLTEYDPAKQYIYFGYPNPDSRQAEKFIDSVYYTFATDSISIVQKTIKIPVNIAGTSANLDRPYDIKIADSSNYDPNAISITYGSIKSGTLSDTIYVKINKVKSLQSEPMVLNLELNKNGSFGLGNFYNRKFKVIASDILVRPTWWTAWQAYMGPYYREVYQKWMEIYYLGADPSPQLNSTVPGPFYSWNNMPTFANRTWYPVLFLYIDVLKKYFNDNVIYPDGDTTKPRILIP